PQGAWCRAAARRGPAGRRAGWLGGAGGVSCGTSGRGRRGPSIRPRRRRRKRPGSASWRRPSVADVEPLREAAMLVDLVQPTTRDGVRLDGAFQAPAAPAAAPLDAMCLAHGTGGSFYSSTLLEAVAERLLGLGVAALRVNTRGHDVMSNAA